MSGVESSERVNVDKDTVLGNARVYGDEMCIDLWYPDAPGTTVRKFVIGLVDVRAADGIRVSYDKERDGWKIEQASTFEWEESEDCDPDWQEVAFIEAWSRECERKPTRAIAKCQG